jgi:3-oxoacyl-[acyl-carrier protein] reductase
VTAASKGLGFATAKAFSSEGCVVAISSSSQDRVEAAATTLRLLGGSIHAMASDVRDPSQCLSLVRWAVAQMGGLDILVNNTGGPPLGLFEDVDDAQWGNAIDLVLMSAVRLSRAALPHLRTSGRGAIVNLTSIAAHQPVENLVLSNALRPGVVAMGKTLAREAAPDVRVNSILTGRFATDRILQENRFGAATVGLSEDAIAARSIARIPMARYGKPEELASAAVFLASDAASFVTGTTLAVDGGEYLGLF